MCGIIGIIDQKADSMIRAATDIIAHRGPDDHGFYNYENLAFGHRRLSILDLSERGHQPMHSPDGRYTIIFNGEMYNHLELRSELLHDITFKSSTDTETILHGYIKYGKEIFSRLNGIFTFSIFDNLNKDLVIVRDHFGIKPLYYAHTGNSLFFASELKALIKLDFDRTIDIEALSRYIYYLYNPGEQTPFKHVKKLKPGHFITINIENPSIIKIEEFYEIPFTGNYSEKSESTLIGELQQQLKNSVERQLLSDVPVGFFLSGGLDSSAIVAMARELHPAKDINCYTINTGGGFDGFSDDLKYAKICAKHLNVDLEIVDADINIVDDFDKMVWHLDEPQADAAPLNVLAISKRAREKGDIVLLGGTAGDDLFSGYRRHQALNYEAILNNIPGFAWKGLNALASIMPSDNGKIRRFKKIAAQSGKSPVDRMAGYYGWMEHKEVIKLFKKEFQGNLANQNPDKLFKESLDNIPLEQNNLNQMLYWEMKYFLPDHNLNYTDKMSMAEGIEVRVPFLDKDLVEFSTTLPPGLKMKGKTTKYLLKKAMEKYIPNEVIYRPKTGFGAPVRKWITEDLDEMIRTRLSKKNLDKWGIFEHEAVWQLIENNKTGKIDASYSIWCILAINSWLDQFA